MIYWKQANNAMRFKAAHGIWFAQMVAAHREGRALSTPEPKPEDYTVAHWDLMRRAGFPQSGPS